MEVVVSCSGNSDISWNYKDKCFLQMSRSFRPNKAEIISFGDTQTVSQPTVSFPRSPDSTPFPGILTG